MGILHAKYWLCSGGYQLCLPIFWLEHFGDYLLVSSDQKGWKQLLEATQSSSTQADLNNTIDQIYLRDIHRTLCSTAA